MLFGFIPLLFSKKLLGGSGARNFPCNLTQVTWLSRTRFSSSKSKYWPPFQSVLFAVILPLILLPSLKPVPIMPNGCQPSMFNRTVIPSVPRVFKSACITGSSCQARGSRSASRHLNVPIFPGLNPVGWIRMKLGRSRLLFMAYWKALEWRTGNL